MTNELTTTAPAELAEFSRGELEQEELALPIVQLTQQLSNAVTNGEVDSGHYYNALTGEDYGTEIDFVPVHYFRGRFLTQDGQTFVATGDTAPSNWPEEYAGRPFADIPDAEETYREDVNNGVREWGQGPPISTTYNYVGFRVEEPDIPIRISLMRSSAPTARKITTLLRLERSNWDRVLGLSAQKRENKQNQPYFVHQVKRGPSTTDEQKQAAITMATAIQRAGGGQLQGDDAASEKPSKPKDEEGALNV